MRGFDDSWRSICFGEFIARCALEKIDSVETKMDGDVKPIILADVALRADLQRLPQIAEQLASMDEVFALYFTTGASNLKVKVIADDIHELHRIVNRKIASIPGLNVSSTDLITEVIKENVMSR